MNEKNLAVIIKKGKALFSGTKDNFHNIGHSRRVEKIALEILASEKEAKVSPLLVSIAAYWHDVYKMSNKFSLKVWQDGKVSAPMVLQALDGFAPNEILRTVQKAIENHSQMIRYIFFPRLFSFLDRLLIEADAIDFLEPKRWQAGVNRANMTYFQKAAFSFYGLMVFLFFCLFWPLFFTFKKSRQIFRQKAKKFASFFLFKEGFFFKAILNRL